MFATNATVAGNSNLVPDHMFTVTGVNASAGTITLFNPWGYGINAVSNGQQASFTLTLAQAETTGGIFYEATGKAAVA